MLVSSAEGGDTLVQVHNDRGVERTRILPAFDISKVADDGDLLGHLGLTPKGPVVFGEIREDQPAERAGLQSGDRLSKLNGEPVANVEAFIEYVRKHPGEAVRFEVLREKESVPLDVLVGSKEVEVEGEKREQGWIGAGFLFTKEIIAPYRAEFRLGPIAAVGASMKKTGQMSLLMLKILGKMASGQASVKNLGGPISIAQSAGKSASYGFTYFLKFLALVSISLGILNLLPIPVLDGGHLLFFVFEWLKGAPLSEEAEMLGQRIGLAILLVLMSLAFYVDLTRLLG
jgi:regulator of sigma E protease